MTPTEFRDRLTNCLTRAAQNARCFEDQAEAYALLAEVTTTDQIAENAVETPLPAAIGEPTSTT